MKEQSPIKRIFQTIGRHLLCPSIPITILIAVPSFALVTWVLMQGMENGLAYASYVLSAYAMIISVRAIVHFVREFLLPLVRRIMESFPLIRRLVTDIRFRAEATLYLGVLMNMLYVVIQIRAGIVSGSSWFYALGGYYTLLVVMRLYLARYLRHASAGENLAAELRRYRRCGCLLLIMSVTLTGLLVYIVGEGKGFHYSGNLIYIMAMYAFYAVIAAIMNMVKFRGQGSPVLSASKAITFIAALVTMLSLETAMLSSFGKGAEHLRVVMTAATGAAFVMIVLAIAIYMIIRGGQRLQSRT